MARSGVGRCALAVCALLCALAAHAQTFPYFPPPGVGYSSSTHTASGFFTSACLGTNTQSGTSYTAAAADAFGCIAMTSSSNNAVAIPANFAPVGTTITVIQAGTGLTSLCAAIASPCSLVHGGVTINAPFGLSVALSYVMNTELQITETSANVWTMQLANAPILTAQGFQVGALTGSQVCFQEIAECPSIYAAAQGQDVVIGAGPQNPLSNGDNYASALSVAASGDLIWESSIGNPIFSAVMLDNTPGQEGFFEFLNSASLLTGKAFRVGIMTAASTTCYVNAPACAPQTAATGSSFTDTDTLDPYCVVIDTAINAECFFRNSYWAAIGQTTPVKWLQASSTGTSQAAVTVGDTNTASTTTLQSGSVIQMANPLKLKVYTVATLPACNATYQDTLAAVSDQSGTPTYGGALTGGGAVHWPAYCNGSAWSAH